jgi:hypothetical protein
MEKTQNGRVITSVAIFVLLILALVTLPIDKAMGSTASSVGSYLTEKNQNYTELSFVNPSDLPKEVYEPSIPTNFSFLVANKDYTYQVSIEKDGVSYVPEQGTISVPKNGSAKQYVSLNVEQTPGRQKISVTLLEINQSISFWIGGSNQ